MYLPVRSSTGFATRATAVLTNKKTSLLKTSLVTIWKTKWRARDMPLVRTQRGAQDSALFSHNYTVLERRRTATERREEDEEREKNDDTSLYLDLDSGNPCSLHTKSRILIISRLTRCCKTAKWISRSNFRGRAHTHAQCSALKRSII